jgi:GNAT superfamily N-acetyltransferase
VEVLERRCQEAGISIRSLAGSVFTAELCRIYEVVQPSFSSNFLASPQQPSEFLAQYLPLEPYILPELVLLAEKGEETVGFIFVIPDWLQPGREAIIDTVIVKTLAVRPDFANQGLATLLAERAREVASRLGYQRAIHALMHEQNLSRSMSQTWQGSVFRRYALYARRLEDVS